MGCNIYYTTIRALVAVGLLILTTTLLVVYCSFSRASDKEHTSRQPETENINTVTLSSSTNNTVTAKTQKFTKSYDFNGTWKSYDYFNKQTYVLSIDANDNLIIATVPQRKNSDFQLHFQDQRNSCVIQPNVTYEYNVENKFYQLGDGRALFKLKDSFTTSNDSMFSEWKIFIIDPKDCSRNNLTWNEEDYSESISDVLPYYNTFDVVIKHGQIANPELKIIRFDEQAREIKEFSAAIQDERLGIFITVKENNPSNGYYYISSFKDLQFVLKRFDDKFKEVKGFELSLGKYLDAYAVNHDKLSICSFDDEDRRNNLTCQIIDSTIFKQTPKIVHLPNEEPISFVTLTNLSEGGFMIVFAKRTEDQNFTVYAQQLRENGTFDKPVELRKVKNLKHINLFEMKTGHKLIALSTTESLLTKEIVRK